MSKVLSAISEVMGTVGSVTKGGTNTFQNYKYAAASDIIHKVQPLMAEAGLVILQSEIERSFVSNGTGLSITYNFALLHKEGEQWPPNAAMHGGVRHTGMSACLNTKGGFDDKAANKCHTAARKYFLLALFQIPTGDYDDADSDADRSPPKIVAMPVAPPVSPPIDKETGELLPPHQIAAPGEDAKSKEWIEWGSQYILGIESSTSMPEFVKWELTNAQALATLAKTAPNVSKRLRAKVIAHKELVTQQLLNALRIAATECTTQEGLQVVWQSYNENMAGLSKEGHDAAAAIYEDRIKKIEDA